MAHSSDSRTVPLGPPQPQDETTGKDMSEKDSTIHEKSADSSAGPDVASGELVAMDKEGNVDVIRESDYTPEQYHKLKRKVDRFLLPLMWFCYGIQQTDKTAIGTQAIFGLIEDTNLVGQQYSWLTTIFYITYLTGEFPSNFLLQRWSIGKSLSIYMLCWGRQTHQSFEIRFDPKPRYLCHLHLCRTELVPTHGSSWSAGLLRVYHFAWICYGCGHLVQDRGTREPSAVVAICER